MKFVRWWLSIWREAWEAAKVVAAVFITPAGFKFFVVLMGTAGAGVLTLLLAWSIAFLMQRDQTDYIAYLAFGMLFTISMVIFNYGKVLAGKQAVEAEFWKIKFKASQDSDDDEEEPKV